MDQKPPIGGEPSRNIIVVIFDKGGFPEYLLDLARQEKDAPGCSQIAARA